MKKLSLADPDLPRLIVTGHPNHELAILGLVQRLRPRLLFLTDGGSEERVEESRRALAALGLLDRARFLAWTEESLYQALLAQDKAVFAELVAQVRSEVQAYAPRQIFCESIELYNPLHDITLPIVRATEGIDGIEIVEFPLIAQIPTPGERYRVQRLPAGRRGVVRVELMAAELAAKLRARADHYLCLRHQLGGVLDDIGDEHAAVECFVAARDELPLPRARSRSPLRMARPPASGAGGSRARDHLRRALPADGRGAGGPVRGPCRFFTADSVFRAWTGRRSGLISLMALGRASSASM
jgi:hypothetical protein